MHSTARRYDIDWIRVIAIGLLMVYHCAIGFQPWGMFIGFITNQESLPSLWPAMMLLNVWRIPLLFFVSGMGLFLAFQKRNLPQLLIERGKRIGIPLLFGSFFIVPIHEWIRTNLLWSVDLLCTRHVAPLVSRKHPCICSIALVIFQLSQE